jgi:hypothetical protein
MARRSLFSHPAMCSALYRVVLMYFFLVDAGSDGDRLCPYNYPSCSETTRTVYSELRNGSSSLAQREDSARWCLAIAAVRKNRTLDQRDSRIQEKSSISARIACMACRIPIRLRTTGWKNNNSQIRSLPLSFTGSIGSRHTSALQL